MFLTRKEIDRRHYLKNKDKHLERVRRWRDNNIDKFKAYCKKWKQDNKERVCLHSKVRNSRVKTNTPKWAKIGPIHQEIIEIYENCPKGMQVDHIIPIQNKSVSGLHVPWNMQYLTKEENVRKNNKFESV